MKWVCIYLRRYEDNLIDSLYLSRTLLNLIVGPSLSLKVMQSFHLLKRMAKFCEVTDHMLIRLESLFLKSLGHNQGHNCVWHSQLPSWVTSGNFDNATLQSIVKTHCSTLVGHYKGKM
jgi:hypothetical protein